jgi:uncharacterized protein
MISATDAALKRRSSTADDGLQILTWLPQLKRCSAVFHSGRTGSRTMPSMIAQELLEILVCPACKQGLEYRQNPESLKCTNCKRVYAVKDDIPIMLVDEATMEG